MIRALSALLLGLTLAGCSDPVAPEGSCVAVVNVHGVMYGTPSIEPPAASAVSAEAYLTITRSTGCLDEGQPSDPLAHGESNFLPVGATLHRIEGFEPEERLAHWSDVLEEWRVLAPHPAF